MTYGPRRPSTAFVHAGQSREKRTLPVPPLMQNSAVILRTVDEGLDMLTRQTVENDAYQRYGNETVSVLEEKVRTVEGAEYALAVNSGMTACYLAFRTLTRAGDHVLTLHSLYHEITDQLRFDIEACGVGVTLATRYELPQIRACFRENTRLVFVETPTNPSLWDVGIEELARECTRRGTTMIVDNTLLTFCNQRPLALGADIALYSTTKSINGHGDALGGILTTNRRDLYDRMRALRDNAGLSLDPFSAWLTVRGMRSLSLRLTQSQKTAIVIRDRLREVFPGLEVRCPTETAHSKENGVAGNGGILSIVFDTKARGRAFIEALQLFSLATTFGNLESLVYHFGTFARPTRDIAAIGIPLGLVRLSFGIEDPEDLWQDLEQAIEVAYGHG